VAGFTATYHDFDTTGMVFRLEQSYSTKEGLNKKVLGYANNFIPSEQVLTSTHRKNGRILNEACANKKRCKIRAVAEGH
jgi:hypothetical protein